MGLCFLRRFEAPEISHVMGMCAVAGGSSVRWGLDQPFTLRPCAEEKIIAWVSPIIAWVAGCRLSCVRNYLVI